MNVAEGCSELTIQSAWCLMKPGRDFRTVDGKSVSVLSPGTWNLEAGPDFRNARVVIGGTESVGDVEIHRRTSDWNAHGHAGDPRYAGVVLHVVGRNDIAPGGKTGPDIPTLILEIPEPDTRPGSIKFPSGKCTVFFRKMNDGELHRYLSNAGLCRFRIKAGETCRQVLLKGAEPAFLGLLFDACGYKANRSQFSQLLSRYMEHRALARDADAEIILWGESGLLPDPTRQRLDNAMAAYAGKCWERWWRLRIGDRPPIRWERSSCRPLNTPERRIAALSAILTRLGPDPLKSICRMSEDAGDGRGAASRLVREFTVTHPLWDGQMDFVSKAKKPALVLGRARAAEIVMNAVLPSVHAYAVARNDTATVARTVETWRAMPSPSSTGSRK